MTSADSRWEYLEGAIAAAKRMGITNEQVKQAVLGPDTTTVPAKYGKEKRISDEVTVIVSPEDKLILYISRTKEQDRYRKSESRSLRKVSGGSSKKHYSIDELVNMAKQQGFEYRRGSKHGILYPPDESDGIIGVPITASDWRAVRNFRAQLIRSGLKLDDEE